jgi:hypothetical protein
VTETSLPPSSTSFTDTSLGSGTYYYRIRAENAIAYSAWSKVVTSSGTTATRRVTIRSSAKSVTGKKPFTLSGRVSPSAPGKSVSVFVKRPGSTKWARASRRTLSAASSWRFTFTPTRTGRYRFYAAFGAAKSPAISVTVK